MRLSLSLPLLSMVLFFQNKLLPAAPVPTPDHWLEQTFSLSKAKPQLTWDFSQAAGRAAWKGNDQVGISVTPDGILLTAKGGDPFITAQLPTVVTGPAVVGLVLRQSSELMYLDLFPAAPGQPFGKLPHLRRLSLGSEQWQTVWFHLECPQLGALRFDTPGGGAKVELASIVIHSLALPPQAQHPVLPKPTWKNTAYVVPIHETFDDLRYDDASRRRDMQQLQSEIGPGRLYLRTGFSASSPQSWKKSKATDTVKMLAERDLVWHVHHHVGNHSIGRHPQILEAVKKDRRNAAWSQDGTCRGVARNWKDSHLFNEEGLARTSVLACISRLNTDVVKARRAAAQWLNETQGHVQAQREFPEVMISAGCSVENELPQSPHAWGCYSPYSVQEFQDWLRHRGGYTSADGAPACLIGKYESINGKDRSVFHDDPSPADANGTGPSFNAWFGTQFTTWKLEYWDLADFPPGSLPWQDDLTNALPAEGQRGNCTAQGFDAPRVVAPKNRYWLAWDNEVAAAAGYRQYSIRQWNVDVVDDFAATGFPRERLFTHQIPAEFLSVRVLPKPDYKTGQSVPLLRRFTTASPTWTADDAKGPFGGCGLGITAFDFMTDEAVFATARACDTNWALLEYHPDSPGQPDYARCMDSLRGLWRQRVHVLAPGWWGYQKPPFLFNGTQFAGAIKDWINNPSGMDARDQPWDSYESIDYTPPVVHGLAAEKTEKGSRLSWSDQLWPDIKYAKWALWREWKGGVFVIYRHLAGKPTAEVIAEVPGDQFSWLDASPAFEKATYTVAARRTAVKTLTGAPSLKIEGK